MGVPHGKCLGLRRSVVALSAGRGTGRIGLGLGVDVPEHHFKDIFVFGEIFELS